MEQDMIFCREIYLLHLYKSNHLFWKKIFKKETFSNLGVKIAHGSHVFCWIKTKWEIFV